MHGERGMRRERPRFLPSAVTASAYSPSVRDLQTLDSWDVGRRGIIIRTAVRALKCMVTESKSWTAAAAEAAAAAAYYLYYVRALSNPSLLPSVLRSSKLIRLDTHKVVWYVPSWTVFCVHPTYSKLLFLVAYVTCLPATLVQKFVFCSCFQPEVQRYLVRVNSGTTVESIRSLYRRTSSCKWSERRRA